MLENVDLSLEVSKADFKAVKEDLEIKLARLQRRARELQIPILVLFEGWDAAGKGTLINELILPLDPRGFKVHTLSAPTAEESLHPFLWRFWNRTPARGRIAVLDRSWYRRVTQDRVAKQVDGREVRQAFDDIASFERQLTDDGCVIVKFFLHISKPEQKKRLARLRADPATAWRVTDDDLRHHKQYKKFLGAYEEMLARTDFGFAPWTVVEAHDRRHAALKIFNSFMATVESRMARIEAATPRAKPAPAKSVPTARTSVLDRYDLTLGLSPADYRRKLDTRQDQMRDLEHQLFRRRIPVVIAFEGWDAAGKGGAIKRLTRNLDPRGYEVVPVAAPNDIEKAHHYLWRFWTQTPKGGHITIFDRSWYGRVLVERVEGFCSETDWRRAYHEINEMEQHLVNSGAVVVKFWLHISPEEQIRRFKEREQIEWKRWKITEEDWRNRKKWGAYQAAVEEMLFRTSTRRAPWTVVEANDKLHARIKVMDTVIAAIRKKL